MRYDAYEFFMQSAKAPASAYIVCAKGVEDAVQAGNAFCQRIFCETHSACGTCLSCRKFMDGNTVDYLELGGEEQIRIGEVRRIPEFLSSAAYEGGYRCIHIKMAHNLTGQSQNYLLKTLEEPPENAVFVLSVDNKQKLLGTIRSRCMEVQLQAQPRQTIYDSLVAEGVVPEKAAFAAAWSGGSPAQARQLLNDEALHSIREHAAAVATRLATKRNPSMYLMEQDLLSSGKRLSEMLYALASLFADAALWPCQPELLTNPDKTAVIEQLNHSFTLPQIQRIIELLNRRSERKQNAPQFRDDLLLKSLIFDILEEKKA